MTYKQFTEWCEEHGYTVTQDSNGDYYVSYVDPLDDPIDEVVLLQIDPESEKYPLTLSELLFTDGMELGPTHYDLLIKAMELAKTPVNDRRRSRFFVTVSEADGEIVERQQFEGEENRQAALDTKIRLSERVVTLEELEV